MSIRRATRQVVASVGAVAAIGAFSILALSGPAGAATPTNGSVVPGAAEPLAPFTAGTPFSSGQGIDVIVPANSVFTPYAGLNIVECSLQPITLANPNGLPTDPSECDGNTNQPNTIIPNADGSVDYQAETGGLYPVYATPDPMIGDVSDSPACGNTAATECILYIGDDNNDFTQPHVWSQPFFVTANGTDLGTNPGDGTPEVPLAIILPIAGMGLLGGTVLIRRRHAARDNASVSV
jgi:hypothetical protein